MSGGVQKCPKCQKFGCACLPTAPHSESVCEKNCPDFNGMALLHKQQCGCSCHSAPSDKEAARVIVYQIAQHEAEIRKMGFSSSFLEAIENSIVNLLKQDRTHFISREELKERVEALKHKNLRATCQTKHDKDFDCGLLHIGYEEACSDLLASLEKPKQ